MADSTVERDLGRLEASVELIHKDIHEIKEILKEVIVEQKRQKELIDNVKGGWKLVLTLASVSSAIGGIVGYLVKLLNG